MCRNIKPLFNYDPPTTEDEIRAAAVQFVRKISGFNKPSRVNEKAFQEAVRSITEAATLLLASLETSSPPRNRVYEITQARIRAARRFSVKEE